MYGRANDFWHIALIGTKGKAVVENNRGEVNPTRPGDRSGPPPALGPRLEGVDDELVWVDEAADRPEGVVVVL